MKSLNFIKGINQYFENYAIYIQKFGFVDGPSLARTLFPNERKLTHDSKSNNIQINLDGIKFPIHLRRNSTDISNFHEIFINIEFKLPSNLDPKLIIDAGANAGFSSIFFLNKYPKSHLISIEPDEENFKMLELNCNQYDNFKSIKSAIWTHTGFVKIKNPDAGSTAFQICETDGDDPDSFKAITVDEIINITNYSVVDILKIDIEGAEKEIFQKGNYNWLENVHILIIELHDRFKPGCAISFYTAIESLNFTQLSKGENLIYINNNFPN